MTHSDDTKFLQKWIMCVLSAHTGDLPDSAISPFSSMKSLKWFVESDLRAKWQWETQKVLLSGKCVCAHNIFWKKK